MTIFSKKILPTFSKIYQLLKNIFGKKTKKSFATVINHITETFASEGLISSEEKKLSTNAQFSVVSISNGQQVLLIASIIYYSL